MTASSGLSDSTSLSLLERARNQDADAWNKISELYGKTVFEWCTRSGLQPNDAADVGQDVFQALTTGLPRFRKARETDTFRGWLWKITRLKIVDHYRRLARNPAGRGGSTAQLFMQQIEDNLDQFEDEPNQQENSDLLRHALAILQGDFQEKTWQAFWLSAIDQLPTATVAEKLNLTTGAVHVYKSRVKRRLLDEFDGLISFD